jgi:ABC-type oligopeptide transport system ATPase subunit
MYVNFTSFCLFLRRKYWELFSGPLFSYTFTLINLNPEINLNNFEKYNFYSQETQCISLIQTNWLMLFRERAVVCFETISDSLNSKGSVRPTW